MNFSVLQIYQRLPGPLRSVAASVHGTRLYRQRYGRETDRLVREALAREHWDSAAWDRWQKERLSQILRAAATDVPYYRQLWRDRGAAGDAETWESLEAWPVLRKERVRSAPSSFVSDAYDRRSMNEDHTSGTTGTALELWQTREATRTWYALHEARTRGWHGTSRHDRWGIVGAQRVVAVDRTQPPFWVWNAGLRQLYLSAYHLAPWSVEAYLEAIRRYRVRHLVGYTNSLVVLARAAQDRHTGLDLKVVITNGECLGAAQREILETGFGCPARETYGLAEVVCGASECEHGNLHLWPDAGVLEVLDEQDRPVEPGTVGRLVATGLVNPGMPLIRYDTNDLGRLAEDGFVCACGRTLPVLREVLGRSDDVVVTRDGRQLVQFDGFFDASFHIMEGQIVQEDYDRFLLRVVPAEGWRDDESVRLAEALRQRVGQADVRVETVERIERTWAGKFRIIVSEVPR